MKYYTVEPEVAGNIVRSVGDWSRTPPKIEKLHYEFDGWLGDVLVEAFACYVVTAAVADEIEQAGCTGVAIDVVETNRSELFMDLHPDRSLPEFRWLQVSGEAGKDDLAISPRNELVVSGRVLSLLRARGLRHAQVVEFPTSDSVSHLGM